MDIFQAETQTPQYHGRSRKEEVGANEKLENAETKTTLLEMILMSVTEVISYLPRLISSSNRDTLYCHCNPLVLLMRWQLFYLFSAVYSTVSMLRVESTFSFHDYLLILAHEQTPSLFKKCFLKGFMRGLFMPEVT